jgi:hypothetical protein
MPCNPFLSLCPLPHISGGIQDVMHHSFVVESIKLFEVFGTKAMMSSSYIMIARFLRHLFLPIV